MCMNLFFKVRYVIDFTSVENIEYFSHRWNKGDTIFRSDLFLHKRVFPPISELKNKICKLFCPLQGVAYVLARWYKWHLWPKLFLQAKFYGLFVLIWFLRVFFVKILFKLDLHSPCKITSNNKILDVKKAILACYHKGLPCP